MRLSNHNENTGKTMLSYWNQFETEELNDMIGVEEIEEEECDIQDDIAHINHDDCPRCMGYGCRYCLLTDW